MAQIKCDGCGKLFDENERTQCPHCDAPIGTLKLFSKDSKNHFFERVATLPKDGKEKLLTNKDFTIVPAEIVFVYRDTKARGSVKNPYSKVVNKSVFFLLFFISLMTIFSCISKRNQKANQSLIDDNVIHSEIDIPRTHYDISLGASVSEVRSIVRGKLKDEVEEWSDCSEREYWKSDNVFYKSCNNSWFRFNTAEIRNGYNKNFYDELEIEFFDDKVDIIQIRLPITMRKEIISKLKEKYPLKERKSEKMRVTYKGGNTGELYTGRIGYLCVSSVELFCSNGRTEVAVDEGYGFVCYRDVSLVKKKKEYWEKVSMENGSEFEKAAEEASEGL